MAVSGLVKSSTMGELAVIVGATSLSPVPYERGDLQITGLGPRLNVRKPVQRRGHFVSLHYGERNWPQLSWTAWLPNLVGSSTSAPGALAEILSGLGAYSGVTGTLGLGRPYTVDLRWTILGATYGDASNEVITANDAYCTLDVQEADDGNVLSIAAELYGPVVVTNGTNTVTYQEIS